VLKQIKRTTLSVTRACGLDAFLTGSRWRAGRVLILCYHGISLEREHEWDRDLYMSPNSFARRLELLKEHRCSVLPLDEALDRIAKGNLPPRSVVITFDDGMFDFHQQAMPLLKSFGFPATVYLTSFFAAYNRPVFFLACSYLLWRHQDRVMEPLSFTGPSAPVALATAQGRSHILHAIERWLKTGKPSAEQQQAGLEELAGCLGADAAELSRKRILHLMTPEEVRDAAQQGFNIQLHTHRHRTPCDSALFAREIDENRRCIQEWTGQTARHFCYPNGTVEPQFEPWLREKGVVSSVTCVPGLASNRDNSLLLPRLVDHSGLSELEFESWLSGTGAFLRSLRP
jgi:peptidoglycan/xylan/chitin deacetylase (PgdA/CDA1 family)